jgi:hypothetical protein
MSIFLLTLKAMGVAILGIAAMHIILGPNADVLLGSAISAESSSDARIVFMVPLSVCMAFF